MSKQFKTIESKGSNKLNLDQYYTNEADMKYCVNKTLDILQEKKNIKDYQHLYAKMIDNSLNV